MPQMVALYNGMGGGSAAAIGAVELLRFIRRRAASPSTRSTLVLAVIGALIGAVSLSGSIIAWAKLRRPHGQALHVPGPADVQRRGGRWRAVVLGGMVVLDRWTCRWIIAFFVAGAGAGHADDAAHRRRRHAGGDLAVQRVHRSGGGFRRLCAGQRDADHRRHDGRRGRHPADAADGQGHEPPDQRRAVLQLRRRRRRNAGDQRLRRSRSRPATSRR